MPRAPSYLGEFASIKEHQKEAKLVLLKYMQRFAPKDWKETHGSEQYGLLLDSTGEEIRKHLFLSQHIGELVLNGFEEEDEDSIEEDEEEEGNYQDETEDLLERHFPCLSPLVFAVGALPDARMIYFVAYHRTIENDLILPHISEAGADFKSPVMSSRSGLIGQFVTITAQISDEGLDDLVEATSAYVSPDFAETEMSRIAGGECSDLVSILIADQFEWGDLPPNQFDVIRSQILADGSVEAFVLLTALDSFTEDEGILPVEEELIEVSIDQLGVMRVIVGFAPDGLFRVLDAQYFPNDIQLSLFRAELADAPKGAFDIKEELKRIQKVQELEKLWPGEKIEELDPEATSPTLIDRIQYPLENLGFSSILGPEDLEKSSLGIVAVNAAHNHILNMFDSPSRATAKVGAVFEKRIELETKQVELEYIVAVSTSVVLDTNRSDPQPNYFLVRTIFTEEGQNKSVQLIGLQTDKINLAGQLRVLCENSDDLDFSILSLFLRQTLPEEVQLEKAKNPDSSGMLQYRIGIKCDPEFDQDQTEIPINIFDPSTETLYNRCLRWDAYSGIIPLEEGVFSWLGVTQGGTLSRDDSSYWNENDPHEDE